MICVNLNLLQSDAKSLIHNVFFFHVQMSVAGCDHLPCSATMLRGPLPLCTGQLHHGYLYGCRRAANGFVIKATLTAGD